MIVNIPLVRARAELPVLTQNLIRQKKPCNLCLIIYRYLWRLNPGKSEKVIAGGKSSVSLYTYKRYK
jgi:hypothetical protein